MYNRIYELESDVVELKRCVDANLDQSNDIIERMCTMLKDIKFVTADHGDDDDSDSDKSRKTAGDVLADFIKDPEQKVLFVSQRSWRYHKDTMWNLLRVMAGYKLRFDLIGTKRIKVTKLYTTTSYEF